jgi:hypothetical protein
MNNTELTSISEDELFFDIHQNTSLINNKKLLQETQTSKNSVSYLSIVDSIDYLGCINGNCSKIECDCKPNEKCECINSKLCLNNCSANGNGSANANANANANGNANGNSNGNGNGSANSNSNINGFVSKLIDFLFIVILIILIVHIVYNKAPDYLIYCLGIILIYIFYKMYSINSV